MNPLYPSCHKLLMPDTPVPLIPHVVLCHCAICTLCIPATLTPIFFVPPHTPWNPHVPCSPESLYTLENLYPLDPLYPLYLCIPHISNPSCLMPWTSHIPTPSGTSLLLYSLGTMYPLYPLYTKNPCTPTPYTLKLHAWYPVSLYPWALWTLVLICILRNDWLPLTLF